MHPAGGQYTNRALSTTGQAPEGKTLQGEHGPHFMAALSQISACTGTKAPLLGSQGQLLNR